jgi:hypothetical protein
LARVRPRDSFVAASVRSRDAAKVSRARAQVEYGLRHVGVALLALGDGVAVSAAKDLGNALCVEKILGALSRYPSWT